MNNFKNIYNKVIFEAKKQNETDEKDEKHLKEVNGETGKPKVIQEDEKINNKIKEDIKEDIKEPAETSNVDDTELNFLNKFIEYIELGYLNSSTNNIINDFKSILGKNSKYAIDILNTHKEERKNRLTELNKELKEWRKKIQDEAENAKNKISLITLLDKSINSTKKDEK